MTTPDTSNNSEALSQTTIVSSAKSCLNSFQRCLDNANKANKIASSLIAKRLLIRVEDQLARFTLWAANLRVFSSSRDSLDSRLREAFDVKDAIVGLLQALDHHGRTCNRSLSSILPGSTKESVVNSLQSFDKALDEVKNDIFLLHKISNTIRRASKESQNVKAAEGFVIRDDEGNDTEPFLRQLFINYIHDRFPGTNENIRNRLADSMVLRRKRILYRRERYGKSSIRLPEPVAKPVISHPRPDPFGEVDQGRVKRRAVEAPTQSHTQSVIKTATTLSPEKFKKAAAPSVISVSKTIALSVTGELSFPPPPTAALMRKYKTLKREIDTRARSSEPRSKADAALEYLSVKKKQVELSEAWNRCLEAVAEVTCPYCFHVLPVREVIDEKRWKMHVKNDLDPYVCLFETCDSADHLYSHSGQWIKHMKEHTLRWRCKSRAHEEFISNTKADYIDHMKSHHTGKFTDAQLSVLADRGAYTSGPVFTQCPLCGADETETSMESHVVGHMRLLALKSLPAAQEDIMDLDDSEGEHSSKDAFPSTTRSTLKEVFEDSDPGSFEELYTKFADPDTNGSSDSEENTWSSFIPAVEEYNHSDDPVLESFVERFRRSQQVWGNDGPPGDRTIVRMDPNCAICSAPASLGCDCEPKALDTAIKQAEERMMGSLYGELRGWVRAKTEAYMKREALKQRTPQREQSPSYGNLDKGLSTEENVEAGKGGNEDIAEPQGSDARLPQVLDYYFGLAEFILPAEDEPAVKSPPLERNNLYRINLSELEKQDNCSSYKDNKSSNK
ncbi:serine threonine phosphatase [Fusarium longipes]|uniref:Serine threonine phosphatase n=1 Tax=Fusarium longipes TaxID=694270 RepID=A0A395T7N8_9HYPO|nr:serine threonine phosphatase [Fusarium longipes]